MKLINKLPNPDAKFDLYFLAFDSPKALNHGRDWTDRQGILELTHNYGSEEGDWQANNGNGEPHKGFGHIVRRFRSSLPQRGHVSEVSDKFTYSTAPISLSKSSRMLWKGNADSEAFGRPLA